MKELVAEKNDLMTKLGKLEVTLQFLENNFLSLPMSIILSTETKGRIAEYEE